MMLGASVHRVWCSSWWRQTLSTDWWPGWSALCGTDQQCEFSYFLYVSL